MLYRVSFVVLALTLLAVSSCRQQSEEPDPLTVDREYLQSEQYRAFSKELRAEQEQHKGEQELINNAVSEILEKTDRRMPLPVSFNAEALIPYTESGRRIMLKSAELTDSEFGRFSYYPVGVVERGEVKVLFFLLRRNGVPVIDMDLMVATVTPRGKVLSARSLAAFRNYYGRETRSIVSIDRELRVFARSAHYNSGTIQQTSVQITEYQITDEGRIIENPS